MPIITICSSANFYKQAVDIQGELQGQGLTVIVPVTAEKMKETGDYDADHYRTWFADPGDYHKKSALIRGHFDKVAEADAILVLNYEKRGVDNYIGGNVLMEMALAFYLKKPIYVMNEIPKTSAFLEEIIGMQPIVMHGQLEKLTKDFKK